MDTARLYPSAFVRQATGVDPVSSMIAPFDTHCVLCAAPLPKGADCTHTDGTTFEKSFGDQPYVGARDSAYVCADCLPLWNSLFLQKYSKSLVTRDGLFKMASNIEQASFLLNPPKDQPFMAFISNTKQQHLIWRTPVNFSAERFTVRLGTQLIVIRHGLLMTAIAAQKTLLTAYREFEKETTKKKVTATTVFILGDREMKTLGFLINPRVVLAAEAKQVLGELPTIEALSVGERWALSIISNSGLEKAEPLIKLLPATK